MAEGFYLNVNANELERNVVERIKERTWSFEGTMITAAETQIEQPDIENTQAPQMSPSDEVNRTFEDYNNNPTTTTTGIRAPLSPGNIDAEICPITCQVPDGVISQNEGRDTGKDTPLRYCTGDVKSILLLSDDGTPCFDDHDDCLPVAIFPKQERAYYAPALCDDLEKSVADNPECNEPELDPYSEDLSLQPSEIAGMVWARSNPTLLYNLTWWSEFLLSDGPQPGTCEVPFTTTYTENARSDYVPDFIEFDRLLKSLSIDLYMKMPIYELAHSNEALWPYWLSKGRIKHYSMFKGRKKLDTKKIFTETENNLKNGVEESIMEVFYETYKIFEGPSEIPLMQPPEGTKRNESQSNNYKRQPSDVEADGIVSDLPGDPPGQQSLYVPPGDNRREAYRLSTFEQFPNKLINAAILARHGFVYTGFYDRVKCFSCGRTVEKWEAVDNPSDRKWHKTDCSFVRGHPTGNIPLGGRFSESFNTLVNSNASQPMDVTPSYMPQTSNGPFTRNPVDIPDLQRGGTYQMRPGSTFVIGSGGQPSRQTAPASQPPATSRPNNPPRGWRMANVISADHKRHLTNLYLNRELDRVASFGRWPTGRPNVSPVSLARAGFFYLGDMDRTQCFSCGGVLRNWNVEDDAMAEHSMHFPNCRFVVGVERRNVPISERPESPRELGDHYPCRFPMNPHMRSEQTRLQTFDRRWPLHKTRAKPEEIAEAGFFFLGENDRVKCWYCNGGLQNWEYDDIPWAEHSKWFPNCQFLLAKKGQLFVYQHLSMNPQLPRPIIGRQDGATVDPSTATPHSSQSPRTQDVPPSVSRARAPSPPPAIIDPQEELRKRRERVDNEMQSDTVKVVITMGYDESLVKRTLMDQLESGTAHDNNNIFEGTASLLDAVMKKEEEVRTEQEEERSTSIKFPTVSSSKTASSPTISCRSW